MDMYKKRELRAKKKIENGNVEKSQSVSINWARCKCVNIL